MISLIRIRNYLDFRLTHPFVGILSRSGISPNALTIIGLAIGIGAAYLIAISHFLIGGSLVLLSGLFDLLDGALARFSKRATKFGAVLDSTIDRITEAAIFLGLLFHFISKGSTLGIVLVFLVMVGSFLVSYVRARAEGQGLECQVGWFTRAERILILAISLLLNQVFIGLWILVVFIYITIIQRLVYLGKTLKKGN
jgi:CDP-diacylglycerol---glycerol-3-phosphate 3-phosphatidyltransferase